MPTDISPSEAKDLRDLVGHIADLRDQLYARYNQTGNLADIEKTIKLCVTLCFLNAHRKHVLPFGLNNLGAMYLISYQDFGDFSALQKAISTLEMAKLNFPSDARLIDLSINLSTAYGKYYDHLRELSSIESAVLFAQEAIKLSEKHGSPLLPTSLFALASAYDRQYEFSHDPNVLYEAIEACQKTLALVDDGDFKKTKYQSLLGWMKQELFEVTRNVELLEEAIAIGTLVVGSTADHNISKAGYLNNLANAYHAHWQYSDNVEDLHNALSLQRHSLEITPDHSQHKHVFWDTLGTLYVSLWQQSWQLSNIEEAVNAHKMAMNTAPQIHARKSHYLINLANACSCMFSQTGDIVHLEAALDALNGANIQEDNPAKPMILNSTANIHLSQFGMLHQIEDIEQAVTSYKAAIGLLGERNAETPFYMQQLGYALRMKYEFTLNYSDIEEAVSVLNQASDIMALDHPKRPQLLIDLGTSYQMQSDHFGIGGSDISMVDKAIAAHMTAHMLNPEEYHFAALSHALLSRFEYSKDPHDIERAIDMARDSLRRTIDSDPYKTMCYGALGNAYNVRYEWSKNLDDIKEASNAYGQVAKLSVHQPDKRLDFTLRWARMSAADPSLHQSTIDAYDYAIKLIPQVVWQGLPLSKRYSRVNVIGDLANEAVIVALGSKQYGLALEWLEQARSILWGQLLRLRSPVEALEQVNPILAEEFKSVTKSLQAINARETVNQSMQSSKTSQQAAQRHRQLAREWELLVEKIQSTTGFEHFLQPHSLIELMQASQYGIIVVITVYQHQCHALVMQPGSSEPTHIPLFNFNYSKAEAMQKNLKDLLKNAGRAARDVTRSARMVSLQASTESLHEILAELWQSVAEPIILGLNMTPCLSPSQDFPHLWWCLTGPMAFLPIHAAGLYSDGQTGSKVSDFMVSSYTPTITSLLEAKSIEKHEFHGLLAISQPQTPGQRILPNTKEELQRIKANMQNTKLELTMLEHSQATTEAVMKGMEDHSWIHFACHALQDISSPLDSSFYLYNGKIELSRIIQKVLPHADFAFLSACQTASGDENLPEESMHLAAGMLAASYSSVIATMWSIMDDDAPIIANEVYKYLLKDVKPDSSKAAYALHHAIQEFQQQYGNTEKSLLSWVPFIHVGV
ncbi:CHAT domain-containing protein [Fomitopsis serialis]|uniref:CHAT domain-containing protein n=1 Tax=Fomitopsis serialis TaxID=139415 RepID=UPI002008A6A5|nr:CHAT domain-containing protein [Neoantrodia serialis]KAH9933736.1 CHAT domain-containing protein [Neoantrodia serialis]